jgi:hypothetical protein
MVDPSGEEVQRSADRNEWASKVTRSFLLVIAVSFFAVSVLGYELHQTRALVQKNQVAIERLNRVELAQNEQRKESRSRFRATDRLQCREIEKMKFALRETAQTRFDNLDAGLAAAHIEKTAEIVRIALAEYQAQLLRFKAVDCDLLPSSKH